MGLIEDARTMLEAGEPTGEMDQCLYCDQYGTHDTGWKIVHDPDCCWPSMPRIVAALEAAQQLLNPALSEPSEYVEDDGRWYWEFCEQPQSEKHAPDCPWQALVEAMRDAP